MFFKDCTVPTTTEYERLVDGREERKKRESAQRTEGHNLQPTARKSSLWGRAASGKFFYGEGMGGEIIDIL